MMQVERQVRSLKLRGASNTPWDQLRYAVEEGLRTASLPGLPPNALVLIKHLDLGVIRLGETGIKLSQRIDALVCELTSNAVCIDTAVANNANVVWFSDSLTPWCTLLRRLCEGRETREWYWRSLLPGSSLVLGPELFTALLSRACRVPSQGLGIARLIESSIAPHRCTRLLPLISEALVQRFLPVQGIDNPEPADSTTALIDSGTTSGLNRSSLAPELNPAWHTAISQATDLWGSRDLRTRWFVYQACLCHRPYSGSGRHIWQQLASDSLLTQYSDPDKYTSRKTRSTIYSTDTAAGNNLAARGTNPELTAPGPHHTSAQSNPGSVDQQVALTEESQAEPAALVSHSNQAGLALVIPVLQRLGLDKLLEIVPQLNAQDLPGKVMRDIAERFAVSESDPCWRVLGGINNDETQDFPVIHRRQLVRFLSGIFQDDFLNSTRLCNGRSDVLLLHELSLFFQYLCARFLWRHCRISTRNLVCRPGRVYVADTHWDIVFKLEQTDLRLRRRAIDSDPGWVPWLGRVVQFHFTAVEH